jgi:hypothetical protein
MSILVQFEIIADKTDFAILQKCLPDVDLFCVLNFQDVKKNIQFTVLTDRSEGGSSINDGQIELMVDELLAVICQIYCDINCKIYRAIAVLPDETDGICVSQTPDTKDSL